MSVSMASVHVHQLGTAETGQRRAGAPSADWHLELSLLGAVGPSVPRALEATCQLSTGPPAGQLNQLLSQCFSGDYNLK